LGKDSIDQESGKPSRAPKCNWACEDDGKGEEKNGKKCQVKCGKNRLREGTERGGK